MGRSFSPLSTRNTGCLILKCATSVGLVALFSVCIQILKFSKTMPLRNTYGRHLRPIWQKGETFARYVYIIIKVSVRTFEAHIKLFVIFTSFSIPSYHNYVFALLSTDKRSLNTLYTNITKLFQPPFIKV